jgi:hypothetical protein
MSGAQGPQGPQCCNIEIDFSNLAELCTLMPRRLLVTGILIQWMRAHFTSSQNIENPLLREALWTDDIATTNITIDSVFKYNAAQTETRPGIFVKPGNWKVVRYGIDDRKMMTFPCNDIKMYNTMYQGSHTLFCIAGESAEAEILASEVYRELVEFGPAARTFFNFLRFVVTDIGEPAILEEATENFVVPVVVSYGAQDVWQICPPHCIELEQTQQNLWRMLDIKGA